MFAQGKSVISIVQDATSFAGKQSSQDDTGHFRMKFCYSGRVTIKEEEGHTAGCGAKDDSHG